MPERVLKDGTTIDIQEWGFSEFKDFISRQPLENLGGIYECFELDVVKNFEYLLPSTIQFLEKVNRSPYYEDSRNRDLTPLEIQDDMGKPDTDYHVILAALDSEELCGYIMLPWFLPRHGNSIFWKYESTIIETRKDYRNLGVASAMIETLNGADFLKGKILQRGPLSVDGREMTDKVFKRTLTAEEYALIPNNYSKRIPPTMPGIYDESGNLLS